MLMTGEMEGNLQAKMFRDELLNRRRRGEATEAEGEKMIRGPSSIHDRMQERLRDEKFQDLHGSTTSD